MGYIRDWYAGKSALYVQNNLYLEYCLNLGNLVSFTADLGIIFDKDKGSGAMNIEKKESRFNF